MIEAKLTKNIIKVENREPLTRGQVNTVAVHFSFSHEWDNLLRIAVFKAGKITRNVTLDETNTCFVPPEVTTHVGESVHVGVHGTKSDGVVVLPSTNACLGIVREGANPGNSCDARTPDLWEQLAGKIALLIEGTYTKEETDNAIQGIIVQEVGEDATKVMSQKAVSESINHILASFDNAFSTLYVKDEVDIMLEEKANVGDVYTKEQAYSKGETDVLIQDAILISETNIWDNFYPRYMIDDKIGYIEDQIGNIDAALDELHNYALSLIGGEA